MNHLIIFALGVMLGTFFGIFIAGLCAVASDHKEDKDPADFLMKGGY